MKPKQNKKKKMDQNLKNKNVTNLNYLKNKKTQNSFNTKNSCDLIAV